MRGSSRVVRLGGAFALSVAVLGAPEEARADERVECASAYEHTQRAQQKSELLAALDAAERCSRPSCPALLSSECTRWVSDIRQKLPGIVVRVRAADGCSRDAAKVEVAGATRKEVDSETLFVDPGIHEVRVTDSVSGKTKTERIDFAAGERRDIDVDFAPPDAVCGTKDKVLGGARLTFDKIPRPTLILGGVGGGLVVIGAGLGIIGAVKRGGLDDCKPNCSQSRLDAVHPFFVAGDIIAGIGLLTLGAAVVSYFALEHPGERARASLPSRAQWLFDGSGVRASF